MYGRNRRVFELVNNCVKYESPMIIEKVKWDISSGQLLHFGGDFMEGKRKKAHYLYLRSRLEEK